MKRLTRRQTRGFGLLSIPFWQYFRRRPSEMVLDSHFHINKEYDAMDFVPTENEIEINTEQIDRTAYICSLLTKWGTLLFIGFSIGLFGAVLTIVLEEYHIFKHVQLSKFLNESLWSAHCFWIAVTMVPVLISAVLLVFVEPSAIGCGIPAVIAYLNGVNIHRFSKGRVAVIKYITTILAGMANLPGGREEPFIHFGALFGASLASLRIPFTKYKPFSMFSDTNGRRDLVTAGTAAAVSVAFGTPIGGILFCLEEGITFWNPRLTFLMFICTTVSTFSHHLVHNWYNIGVFHKNFTAFVFFDEVKDMKFTYQLSEIPNFICFGVIGAILGVIWINLHIGLHILRTRFLNGKTVKLIEATVFGILIVTVVIVSFHLFSKNCIKNVMKETKLSKSLEFKYYCEENEIASICLFIFNELRNIIGSLFLINEKGALAYSINLFATFYYLILSAIQEGTHLPSGILIPNLIAGGAWGHLMSQFLFSSDNDGKSQRAKYAFLGAVAQASGVARLTLSIGIIMVESCGQTNFAVPIFIVVLTAKWFGGIFSEPIFRIMGNLRGYPLLRATLLPVSGHFNARTIMGYPLVTLPLVIRVNDLLMILHVNHHHYYPITSDNKVVGIISRTQIFALLKSRTFTSPQNAEEIENQHKMFHYFEGESYTDLKKDIVYGTYYAGNTTTLDFSKYMNKAPYKVHEDTTLKRLYLLFLALGPGYVLVVDGKGQVIGMVTRKDIARYRRLIQLFLVRTEIAPIM